MEKVLITASVASMIDLFNRDNIKILQEMGKEVHIASNFAFGSITSQQRVEQCKKELEQAGVIVHHIPIPRRVGAVRDMIQSYRELSNLMKKQHFRLIHTQSPIGGVLTRLAARKSHKNGTKVIYTAHGFHFFKGASVVNWLLFYPIERICAHDTDILLTMNEEDLKRAKSFHAGEIDYIPGIGIDLEKFDPCSGHPVDTTAMRKKYGFSDDDYILMSVGQLSHRKNQETVIQAMADVPDSRIKYCIVGLGEYEERFRRLIRELHLEDRVKLAGYSPRVQELLQMADCFIFPSLQEGLPVSLMEAMASQKPIICSKIRGNTDLITDKKSGLLVEAKDCAGYAHAIEYLYANPKQAEIFAKNARRQVEKFSKERVHAKMREIYKKILK